MESEHCLGWQWTASCVLPSHCEQRTVSCLVLPEQHHQALPSPPIPIHFHPSTCTQLWRTCWGYEKGIPPECLAWTFLLKLVSDPSMCLGWRAEDTTACSISEWVNLCSMCVFFKNTSLPFPSTSGLCSSHTFFTGRKTMNRTQAMERFLASLPHPEMVILTSVCIRNECSRNGIDMRGKWFSMPRKRWKFRWGLTLCEPLLL